MKILLIEDSKRLQTALGTGLRKKGFALDVTGDGEEGLHFAEINDYDVIILDLMLPGLDGLTILERLRKQGKDTNILILTAKHTLEDRVHGLSLGADDYLTKPFAFEELLARIQALVRRRYNARNPVISIGSLRIDTVAKTVTRKDHSITLSPREYALLPYMAFRQGQLITRGEIEEHLYGDEDYPASNAVDSAICNLRKKIHVPGEPGIIRTRRGMGYVLKDGPE
jgi:DNA-binding response OmpR family regulator